MPIARTREDRADHAAPLQCWSCRAPAGGTHFCAVCGKIQPLPPGTDYFAFFGLPLKLGFDEASLEGLFHKLSWKLHPDNFVRSGEFERNLSLERSSELNDAYRTLSDPLSRVEYLLARLGVRKEGSVRQQAPPELLEEVFELNESLDELREARRSGGDTTALREKLAAAQKEFQLDLDEVDENLVDIGSQWDAALDARSSDEVKKTVLARLNETLNRRGYIRNLVKTVNEELAG